MKTRLWIARALLGAVLMVGGSLAWSVELSELKAEGLVGERADGYLGIVPALVAADVKALVADVNGKRRERYEQIAAQHNLELSAVEALAGKKALEKTASGHWIYLETWQRKP